MRKVYLLLVFVCLFGIGVWISPYVEKYVPDFVYVERIFTQKNSLPKISPEPIMSAEVFVETKIDPAFLIPLEIKKSIDEKLKPSIDTDNPLNLGSPYKDYKKEIIDGYNSPSRDKKATQLFLYLASLENNDSLYEKTIADWCKKQPEECRQSEMPVVVSGTVIDEKGSPISGARIVITGETHETKTNNEGHYSLTFKSFHPRRLRITVHHPDFAGGNHTFITQDTLLMLGAQSQTFEKNFSLIRTVQKVVLHVAKKKIISGDASVTGEGFLIENEYSKYLIPFDSIRTPDKKLYTGQVSVSVFEFNRDMANEFLQGDVFHPVYEFASEGLQTYSMPLIFFYDNTGRRLEVFRDTPMTVWTTNRELQNLILENAQGIHRPGFNPEQYEEEGSVENVTRYVAEDELKAYIVSQENPGNYPITLDWIYKNYSRLPGFFVCDQSTGIWESVGYSLVAPSTAIKHSIQSLFWTKK